MRTTLILLTAALLAAAPASAADGNYRDARKHAQKVRSLRSNVSADERKVSWSEVQELKEACLGTWRHLDGCGERLEHRRKSSLERALRDVHSEMEAARGAVDAWQQMYERGKDVERYADQAQDAIDDALEAWIDLENELQRSQNELVTGESRLRSRRESITSKAEDLKRRRDETAKKADAEFAQLERAYDAYVKAVEARVEAMKRHDRAQAELFFKSGSLTESERKRLSSEVSKLRDKWRDAEKRSWTAKRGADREDADFDRAAEAAKKAEDAHIEFLGASTTVETIRDHSVALDRLRTFREDFGDV